LLIDCCCCCCWLMKVACVELSFACGRLPFPEAGDTLQKYQVNRLHFFVNASNIPQKWCRFGVVAQMVILSFSLLHWFQWVYLHWYCLNCCEIINYFHVYLSLSRTSRYQIPGLVGSEIVWIVTMLDCNYIVTIISVIIIMKICPDIQVCVLLLTTESQRSRRDDENSEWPRWDKNHPGNPISYLPLICSPVIQTLLSTESMLLCLRAVELAAKGFRVIR